MTEATAQRRRRASSIAPFEIEVDHPRNSDVMFQGLYGVINQRLRSRLKPATKTVATKKQRSVIHAPQCVGQSLPEIPGMRLQVNPAQCSVRVVDPLHNNDKLRGELQAFIKATQGSSVVPPNGVEPAEGKMDEHRMKTLCREILVLIEAEEVVLKKGPKFDLDDCNDLPGNYLLNPASRIPNSQPQFEKDLPAYAEKLNNLGH